MRHCRIRGILSLTILLGFFTNTQIFSADKTWNGVAGDKLWSNNANWTPSKPTTADDVVFGSLDATGTSGPSGNSNNIVDAAFANAVKSIRFTNTSGFHNVRLTNNLVVSGSGATPAMFVGTGQAGPNFNQTVVATIQGNATFGLTNTTGTLIVCQGTNNTGLAGSYKATLNLVGLDTFAASLSAINLAINSDGNTSLSNNRPCGDILLARTNMITATSITVSESFNNGGAQSAFRLGQTNSINVDTLRIGSRKGNGALNFNTGLASPTAKFRNKAGTGRGTWYIGEDLGSASGTGATGLIDLTGGTVDATVGTLYVGKGQTVDATGDGTGTLTFNLGTIDATTVEIGYQTFGGGSVGRGTVNVNGTGLLKVSSDIRLGFLAAGNSDTTTGTLNVNAGTVTVPGNIVDGGADVSTTTLTVTNGALVNLKPSGDSVAGNITVDNLNIGVASITNYDTLSTTNIVARAPATTFTAYAGESLAPAGVGTSGLLKVTGGMTLTNSSLKLDLGSSSDSIAVSGALELDGTNSLVINPVAGFANGTYVIATFGTFVGDPAVNIAVGGSVANSRSTFTFDTNTPNTLTLTVGGSGSAALTWSGDGAANLWNLITSSNWNAGAGPNTEMFYNLDAVTFDDNGSATPPVSLVGTLIPTSVVVTGTNAYTFSGSGKLSGAGGLTANTSGGLTLLTTNDYSGGTVINALYSVQVGDGSTANGGIGTGEVQNYGTLTFKPRGTQTITALISQYGNLFKTGPGTTVLSGANTFSGPLAVNEGILRAGNALALGSTADVTVLTNGGTLDVNGFNLGNEPIIASGSGVNSAGAIINSGASQGNALNDVTLTGDTTFGGTTRWDLSALNSTSTEPGLRANGYNLTKAGTNQISFTSYNSSWTWNTGLGNIDCLGGILSIQAYVNLGANTNTLIIRSNAAVEFCHNGPTVLDKPISMTNGCIMGRFFSASYPPYTDLQGPINLSGSNVFDVFATTMTLVVDGEIGGSGTLAKAPGGHTEGGNTSTGVGTLLLTASNSFSGDLRVQTGTVILSNNASVTRAANIAMAGGTLDASKRTDQTLTLANTQTLKGNGTITGIVTSPSGTTVAPGLTGAAATLTVSGGVNLAGATVMDITKTNITLAADKITTTSGTIDLGGSLTVNFAGNTALSAGNKFTLLHAAAYVHSFASTNLPVLGSGLLWSNSITSGDWNIEVVGTEPATPPYLTNSVSGSNLTLSWSTAYSTYILEAETNNAPPGITTNAADWHPVPGVSSNQITIPMDLGNGSVFYRLRK